MIYTKNVLVRFVKNLINFNLIQTTMSIVCYDRRNLQLGVRKHGFLKNSQKWYLNR